MGTITHKSGKRKRAIARTTIKEGKGDIRINSVPLEIYGSEIARLKIQEAVMLASGYVDMDKINIKVNVRGGGVFGQADAIASSIARALVDWTDDDELLEGYVGYSRTLIAGDHRQTEMHKPGQSSKGPRHKRQKSYR